MCCMSKKNIQEEWECSNENCGFTATKWTQRCPRCHNPVYPSVADKGVVKLHRNPNKPYPKEPDEK